MLDALYDYLPKKPSLCAEEMAIFLWDGFKILPSSSSIILALLQAGWAIGKPIRKPKNKTYNYENSTNISYSRDLYCLPYRKRGDALSNPNYMNAKSDINRT